VKHSQAQLAKSFQTPTSSCCQHINANIPSSHHHHPLLSPPLPHPSYSTTLNTTSTTYASLTSPSPLLRDVGWYLKCYLSPPGAPQPTRSQQTQQGVGSVGGETEGEEQREGSWRRGVHFHGVDNGVVCTSHAAPFSLPKHFFCGIDNGAVCTSHAALFPLAKHLFSVALITGQCESHTAPFPLAKHLFSAASITGQCESHTLPRLLLQNTFSLRR